MLIWLAQGGTLVTLHFASGRGVQFTSTLAVRVAGIDTFMQYVSDLQLDIVTPAHPAGTVSVAVTVDGSQWTLFDNVFEYVGMCQACIYLSVCLCG